MLLHKIILSLLAALPLSFSYAGSENINQSNQIEQLKLLVSQILNENAQSQQKVYLSDESIKVGASMALLNNTANNMVNLLKSIKQDNTLHPIPNLQWLRINNMSSLPKTSLVNAGFPGKNVSICRGEFLGTSTYVNDHATYPGQLTPIGCRISYGGYAFIVNSFDVLAGSNLDLQWKSISEIKQFIKSHQKNNNFKRSDIDTQLIRTGFMSPDAMSTFFNIRINGSAPIAGGMIGGHSPVLICRVKQKDNFTVGKVVYFDQNDACNIGENDKEVVIQNDYEILFWKSSSISNT